MLRSSRRSILTAVLLGVSAAAAVAEDADDETQPPCRLWAAPSTLSNDNEIKYGLFAGVDYEKDEELPHPELAIPLIDFLEAPNKEASRLNRDVLNQIEHHVWASDYAAAKFEGNFTTTILVPGYGIMANYHTGISNVDWLQGASLLRGRPKFTEPGKAHLSRGSITPFDNLTMKATANIKAGSELFANFGESWDGDTTTSIYEDKITRQDYAEADKILNSIVEFMDKFDDQMTDELKDNVLDFMLDKALEVAADKRASILRSLIPAHPSKLRRAQEMGGVFYYRNKNLIRNQKFFEAKGVCVDQMRSGPSTIPEAGRGAFATRKIKEGSVITVVPMQPVAHKQVMNMYAFIQQKDENGDNKLAFDRRQKVGEQLAVNYCFGHPESSVLLMPLGPMISYVNHAPGDEEANAHMNWVENPYLNDGELMIAPIEALARAENPKLAMELVASRDIEPDEEIFLDYGDLWAAAWQKYKSTFDAAHPDGKWPAKAEDLLLEYKDKPFPSNSVRSHNPYPQGIAPACYLEMEDVPDGNPRYEGDVQFYNWAGSSAYEDISGQRLQLCNIVGHERDDVHIFNYTVLGRNGEDNDPARVHNVPHSAITLVDKSYSSDIHEKLAFRHYIGIEDEKFPQSWRNKRK